MTDDMMTDDMMTDDMMTELLERDYLFQCTDIDALKHVFKSPFTFYVGFDCTADSLHIGSLIQLMFVRLLRKYGHKPIILIGDITTRFGDPSGKDKTREMLTVDEINSNSNGLINDISKVLREDVTFKRNSLWYAHVRLLPFIFEVSSAFTLKHMLNLESVKNRNDRQQGMSFSEFLYPIMQAYDFVELWTNYNCLLQIGGSDQWGNITSGVSLGKSLKLPQLFGMTTPLVTTHNGEKMGKSVDGAVWLNHHKYSVEKFWQYFRNVHDEDVGKFLRWFTDLPISEITKLEMLKGQDINIAKNKLADCVTKIVHPDEIIAPVVVYTKKGEKLVKILRDCKVAYSLQHASQVVESNGCIVNGNVINDVSYKIQSYSEILVQKKYHIVVHINI